MMVRPGLTLGAAVALMMLAGCGGDTASEPGGVTSEESAALNNAAEMLDASPDSMTAPEDMPLEGELNEHNMTMADHNGM